MEEKYRQLSALGAGEFEHINGQLIDHLEGTKSLLEQWHAPTVLQDAGLYHAAYGTAGFEESFTSTARRQDIAFIIGKEAEDIVYTYCACDRDYFWPQFSTPNSLQFRNRFSGELLQLTHQQLCHFCELTVANEIEIAQGNSDFINSHGDYLLALFTNMQPYLSKQARSSIQIILGENNTWQVY